MSVWRAVVLSVVQHETLSRSFVDAINIYSQLTLRLPPTVRVGLIQPADGLEPNGGLLDKEFCLKTLTQSQ